MLDLPCICKLDDRKLFKNYGEKIKLSFSFCSFICQIALLGDSEATTFYGFYVMLYTVFTSCYTVFTSCYNRSKVGHPVKCFAHAHCLSELVLSHQW